MLTVVIDLRGFLGLVFCLNAPTQTKNFSLLPKFNLAKSLLADKLLFQSYAARSPLDFAWARLPNYCEICLKLWLIVGKHDYLTKYQQSSENHRFFCNK